MPYPTPPPAPRSWRAAAEEAAHEHDAKRMTELLEELLRAFERANMPRSGEPKSPAGGTKGSADA